MFIPGVVTFTGLSASCLVASTYLFHKPVQRLPEWRWLSVILAAAFGVFALSFAQPSSFARPVAEGLIVLTASIELIVVLRRDQGRSKGPA